MKAHVTRRYMFSASHRLHSENMSEAENLAIYGKCSNPHGHGHNYEVQVTLSGEADDRLLTNIPEFERVVAATVIDRFDHKNLNVEVAEFREVIPTVENQGVEFFKWPRP